MFAMIQNKIVLAAALAIIFTGSAKADFQVYGNVKAVFGSGANPLIRPVNGAIVEIYEGSRLIGRTQTIGDGTFRLTCRSKATRQNPSHKMVIHVSHLGPTKGWPSKTWNHLAFNNDPRAIPKAIYSFSKPR